MDSRSPRDWSVDLFALKSSLARLKIDKKQESLKDLEKCIDKLYGKACTSHGVPAGDRAEWTVLSSLCEVVRHHDVRSELISKVCSLFQCFAEVDQELAFFLFHCCDVLSLVATELDRTASHGCVLESVRLLCVITKYVTMMPTAHGAEKVFILLLKKIKTESNMEVLHCCLESVANIARGNVAFQSIVRTKPLLKEVHSRLIQLLSKKNPGTNVATLRVLANLSLNTSLGEAMFSPQNIESTFGVIFNVFYRQSADISAVSNAVDLMIDMLKCERIRKAFTCYKHLRVCVQSTIILLVFLTGPITAKLCELFQCFLSIDEIHQMIMNLFFTRVSEISDSTPPEVSSQVDSAGALQNSLVVTLLLSLVDREPLDCAQGKHTAVKLLQLLKDIFEGAASCGLLHSVLALTKYVCPLLQRQLLESSATTRDHLGLHQRLTGVETSLDILLAIACIDTAPAEVAQFISSDLLSSTWEWIGSIPREPWWAVSLSGDAKKSIVFNSRSCAELKLTTSLKLLELLKLLSTSTSSSSFRNLLQNLLHDAGVAVLVGRALLSEDSGDVGKAIRIIQHTSSLDVDASHELCGGVMTACGEYTTEIQERMRSEPAPISQQNQQHHQSSSSHGIAERHSLTPGKLSTKTEDGRVSDVTSRSPDVDVEAVERLIHMMKSGMEMKDVRSSEIMMVYECKLQNMQTKETHLQELLEAKANALFHADRLNSQYRNKMAQIETECMKLRSLLQDAEKRNERTGEEICSVQSALEQSQKDRSGLSKKIAHLTDEMGKMKSTVVEHEALRRELTHLRTKYEDLQKTKLKVDHKLQAEAKKIQELEEQIVHLKVDKEKLQSDLQRTEEDRLQLTRHISAQEKQFQELKNGIASFERRVQEMDSAHKESLQKNRELMHQLAQMQEERKQLMEEMSLLQDTNHQLDVCVEEQKKEIDTLFGKNEVLNRKLQHIQSILH